MNAQLVITMILAAPVIVFPAAFIWYVNVGGIATTFKEVRARRTVRS